MIDLLEILGIFAAIIVGALAFIVLFTWFVRLVSWAFDKTME